MASWSTLTNLVLLAVSPVALASPHAVQRRQAGALPGNWTSLGCYTDSIQSRTLTGPTFTDLTNMTHENCINFCDASGFLFSGIEFSRECFCDNNIRGGADEVDITECAMPCTGNAAQTCGSDFRLNLFWSGVDPPPAPETVPSVGDWVSLGCHSDNVGGVRALPVGLQLSTPTTIQACTTACFEKGYQFAGTEFAAECFCGTTIGVGSAPTPALECNMVCAGNSTQFCGGPNRLNLYNYTGTDLPPVGGTPEEPPEPPKTPEPVTVGLPEPWAYAACYVDNAFGRVFEVALGALPNATVASAIAACNARGFSLTGIEFKSEVYCGNRLINGAVKAAEATCNLGCTGDETQACGGANRLSVYSTTEEVVALPVPIALATGLAEGWSYQGCFTDLLGNTKRVLPSQHIFTGSNGPAKCIATCSALGFDAAGLESQDECYCGAANAVATRGGVKVAENQCHLACSGDPIHLCGGDFRLQLYSFTAPETPEPPSEPTETSTPTETATDPETPTEPETPPTPTITVTDPETPTEPETPPTFTPTDPETPTEPETPPTPTVTVTDPETPTEPDTPPTFTPTDPGAA